MHNPSQALIARAPLASARWAWLGLIALQAAWFGAWAPIGALGRPAGVALFVVPLLVPAPWIFRLNLRGLVVGGLILLFHFCVAVAEAWTSPAARAPALIQIVLIAWYYLALLGIRRGELRGRA
ncbi:MAG: DUF2069 domain-containing protein [Wenzhouxiangellaceae bacterium]|nr:DUF2069 domain-containing protein [Wenzhouxiangellaceae bacterium]